jgi:hypothetical protein
LSAQAQQFGISMKKSLHWASVVRGLMTPNFFQAATLKKIWVESTPKKSQVALKNFLEPAMFCHLAVLI